MRLLKGLLKLGLKDPEFWFIVFYNLMIIVLYYGGKLEPMFVIWAYLLQSIAIGAQYVVQNFIRTVRRSGSIFPLKQHAWTGFFMVHYGGFHFGYIIFVFVMTATQITDADVMLRIYKYVGATATFLLVSLLFYTVREALPNTPYRRIQFGFIPYLRILPMHLVIILGLRPNSFILNSFLVFMILKLFFDILMYVFTAGDEIVTEVVERNSTSSST